MTFELRPEHEKEPKESGGKQKPQLQSRGARTKSSSDPRPGSAIRCSERRAGEGLPQGRDGKWGPVMVHWGGRESRYLVCLFKISL